MKAILAILLIGFSPALFAQSKKKLNVQLTNQLSAEKARYDSLATTYNNTLSVLFSARSLAGNTLYKSLGNINYAIEERRYELTKQMEILQSLHYHEMPDFRIYNKQLTFYYALKAETESKFDFDFPERKAIAPLNLNTISKISDRNSKMATQIGLYKNESEALKSEIAEMLEKKAQLNVFNSSSDDLVLEYSNELNRLTEYFNQVKRMLLSAREEFAEKGPKGFDGVYFKAFPDVFPDTTTDDFIQYQKVEQPDTSSYSLEGQAIDPAVDSVYNFFENESAFPGGWDSLVSFLVSNTQYPDFAFTNKIGGKCFVEFIVSKNGTVSNAKIKRGIPYCSECDAEAIRVILSMPAWKPGEKDGVPVNQWRIIPIVFKIPE